jgi:dCTP deaminase
VTYLADWQIREMVATGQLVIEPWYNASQQPVSYDVHLGPIVKTETYDFEIDNGESGWREWDLNEIGKQWMPSRKFWLASTVERFEIPNNVVGVVRDKSTLARRGVFMSHGLLDPGFKGHVTLEFVNHSSTGILLEPGMPIGQVTFQRVAAPVSRPYGHEQLRSHYQDQEATPQIARA